MSVLSRRMLLSAAAVPAAVAAAAMPAPALANGSTTLPTELIERFVRMRAWYLDYRRRERLYNSEVDRRFYAATGLTRDEWFDLDCNDRRSKGLDAVRNKIRAAVGLEIPDPTNTEVEELSDERWAVAENMVLDHKAKSIADLAWQLEAFLIADVEILEVGTCPDEWMLRTLLQNIRTLGGLPQPEDPAGELSLKIASEDDADRNRDKPASAAPTVIPTSAWALAEKLKPLFVEFFPLAARRAQLYTEARKAAGWDAPSHFDQARWERAAAQTDYSQCYRQVSKLLGRMRKIARKILALKLPPSSGIRAAAFLVTSCAIDVHAVDGPDDEVVKLVWELAASAGFAVPEWMQDRLPIAA